MNDNQVKRVTLANSFTDIAPPTGPYGDAFLWPRVVNAFSGGVFNPWWGARGALMLHGGGHADTNHNAVVALDLNDLTYKLVRTSEAIAGIQDANNYPTAASLDREFGEHLPFRVPAAAHTYDHLVMLPPWVHDAEYGTLLRPAAAAWHTRLSGNSSWAHKLRLVERAALSSRNAWTRASVNGWSLLNDPGPLGQPLNNDAGADIAFRCPIAGGCADYDPVRNRVWWRSGEANHGRAYWLDCATARQNRVNFTGGSEFVAYVDLYSMRYLALRDWLVLFGCTVTGTVVGATMDPNNPAGAYTPITFIGNAFQHGSLPTQPAWDYCPETGTIFMHMAGDTAAVYEISIPATRTGNWNVTRRPFSSGNMIGHYVNGKRFFWHPPSNRILYLPGIALAGGPAANEIYCYRPPNLSN